MSVEENKEIVRHILEDYDAAKLLKEGGYGESPFHSPSYMDHGSMGNNNLEQLSQIHCELARGFPDFKITIEDMVGENDKVSVRYRLDGTNLGEHLGIPPTGKKVYIKNQGIFLIKEGKLQESWRISELLDFMRQIRVLL
jgi:predicted ester cyclase